MSDVKVTVSGPCGSDRHQIAEAISIDLAGRGIKVPVNCFLENIPDSHDLKIFHRSTGPAQRTYTQAEVDSLLKAAYPCGHRDPEVEAFLDEVRQELIRARKKFPGDRIMTLAMAEEAGELVKAVLDEPAAAVRKEAVQTATMAARIVLDGDESVVQWRAQKGLDQIAPGVHRLMLPDENVILTVAEIAGR